MIAISDDMRREVDRLCHEHGVVRLELFGSAAGPEFKPTASDVDLVVEFGELESGRYADAYFELLAGLEVLFGRKVDLVVDRAIRNPYFRQKIDQSRTLLYAA